MESCRSSRATCYGGTRNMKSAALLVAVALSLSPCALGQKSKNKVIQKPAPRHDSMPLTTKSAKVSRLVDEAWVLDSDKGEPQKALELLRKVVKMDSKFAMGHELLA